MSWIIFGVFGAAAFLTGGIPFGYLAGRLVLKDDIRRHGSGNIGATNVGRVLGWKWGTGVLALDALKGLIPTALAGRIASQSLPQSQQMHLVVVVGVLAILGHMYPIYLRLRGGKGVATALGVVLMIAPWSSLAALLVFLVTFAASRIVALSSIMAAAAFSAVQFVQLGASAWTASNSSLTAFSLVIPLLIIWRHRSNIRRLLDGKETRFRTASPEASNPSASIPDVEPAP